MRPSIKWFSEFHELCVNILSGKNFKRGFTSPFPSREKPLLFETRSFKQNIGVPRQTTEARMKMPSQLSLFTAYSFLYHVSPGLLGSTVNPDFQGPESSSPSV